MSTRLLDEEYLNWLYSQVADENEQDPSLTYWILLRYLYKTEFAWIIPNDDNRLEDGRGLRREFLESQGIQDAAPDWIALGCSTLELMVGLSRHLSFQAEGEAHYWFWRLMENIRLHEFCDTRQLRTERIEHILTRLMKRTYKPNGDGGFFPLKRPAQNQTGVELWYQLAYYVLELEE